MTQFDLPSAAGVVGSAMWIISASSRDFGALRQRSNCRTWCVTSHAAQNNGHTAYSAINGRTARWLSSRSVSRSTHVSGQIFVSTRQSAGHSKPCIAAARSRTAIPRWLGLTTVTPAGAVTTIAGNGAAGSNDGTALPRPSFGVDVLVVRGGNGYKSRSDKRRPPSRNKPSCWQKLRRIMPVSAPSL
jgi:hypothetical protein